MRRELRDDIGMLRGDIVKFLGIVFVIVEFGLAIAPANEAAASGADALAVEFVAVHDEREGSVFDAGGGICQNRA